MLLNSMRRTFFKELYIQMKQDKDIWVVTGDLGYKGFDIIRDEFTDRFINVGASEQVMMGIAVGLAMAGKKPFVYSITPFLLYRPFETIRNYINHEKIAVRMIGSGRDKDYAHDGFSHWAQEDKAIMKIFGNIACYWPDDKNDIADIIDYMVNFDQPYYLNLRR
jgi:transketolase